MNRLLYFVVVHILVVSLSRALHRIFFFIFPFTFFLHYFFTFSALCTAYTGARIASTFVTAFLAFAAFHFI